MPVSSDSPGKGQIRDAQRATQLSEERFRRLVESVKDYAIFMLDPQGRVQSWNIGAERTKGYKADEIIGQSISRFYTEEDQRAGKPARLLGLAAQNGRVEDEGWRVRKDGTLIWADVVITAIYDDAGNLTGFAKVTRDLTDRRRAEEERLRLAQAQEAIRLRDEFLSIASHELRTPLTALQLQLHGLQERAARVDQALADKVEKARRSTDRLAQLTEALLDVARLSTGKLVLSTAAMDLGESVNEVVEHLADAAHRAKTPIHVNAEKGVVGHWDKLRVEQIVSNLVGNAIKYAAGEPVEVHVRREGDLGVIVVRDHGPGVPEAALPRIFGRFERGHSMAHFGGLGLGLYVAHQIAEAHGGSITAENAEGGGAQFTVRLPLTRST